MVVIIDPHLKRVSTYPVYQEAQDLEILVKNSNSGEYEGWCWSGSSAWVDFFNPKSWDWWKGLFKVDGPNDKWHWSESTVSTYIWNDMNEVGFMLQSAVDGTELTVLPISLLSSMARKSACPARTSITADGSTVTCTTSTACSSYVCLRLCLDVRLTSLCSTT